MKKIITYPTLMILLLAIVSCSSKPSENDGRLALEQEYRWSGDKIVEFKKTNGQKINIMGAECYKIEFKSEIESPYGYKEDISGIIVFEQTEKGWRTIRNGINPTGKQNIEHHESSAMAALKLFTSAEAIWLVQDCDRNGIKDYWTYDVSCLHRMLRSDNTTNVAFIASDLARADASPCVYDQSTKTFGALPQIGNWASVKTVPKSGYWFRTMITDENSNPYNQNTVGGDKFKATSSAKFAFVAYPAGYGKTGRETFIVNQEGTIYSKDLGSDANKIVLQWPGKNPADAGWKVADY